MPQTSPEFATHSIFTVFYLPTHQLFYEWFMPETPRKLLVGFVRLIADLPVTVLDVGGRQMREQETLKDFLTVGLERTVHFNVRI
jgi:hypothetical protein